MNTFILSPQTANLPVQDLLNQAAKGGVTVVDAEGNTVAYVYSPADREEFVYSQAQLDLDQHREELTEALNRRGGVTTKELLEKAQAEGDVQQQS